MHEHVAYSKDLALDLAHKPSPPQITLRILLLGPVRKSHFKARTDARARRKRVDGIDPARLAEFGVGVW